MKTNKYLLVYFLIIIIYTCAFCLKYSGSIGILDSAGLGSFLSGLFAPLAFLYLYLSYRHQEKALNQTQKDILEQIKIQNDMLELQIQEKREREYKSLPLIEVNTKYLLSPLIEWNDITKGFDTRHDKVKPIILITLTNSGKEVQYFNCDLISPCARNMINRTKFIEDQKVVFKIHIEDFNLDSEGTITLNFENSYVTSIGVPYTNKFKIKFLKSNNRSLQSIIQYSSESPVKLGKSVI
ncbi:MAG: hypothetical protein IE909_14125 [Campylobacterales bacterium]|nr:hypothetical protein [Campylobacterales bacterium]